MMFHDIDIGGWGMWGYDLALHVALFVLSVVLVYVASWMVGRVGEWWTGGEYL